MGTGNPPTGEPAAAGQAQRRVLVVDDDPDVREALTALLGAEGYGVRACSAGREALDVVLAGWAPELIILDLLMPGMDGRDFRGMQLAGEAGPPVPVVVLSAAAGAADEAAALGAAAAIAKPFAADELLRTVRRLLGAHPPAAGR